MAATRSGNQDPHSCGGTPIYALRFNPVARLGPLVEVQGSCPITFRSVRIVAGANRRYSIEVSTTA